MGLAVFFYRFPRISVLVPNWYANKALEGKSNYFNSSSKESRVQQHKNRVLTRATIEGQ